MVHVGFFSFSEGLDEWLGMWNASSGVKTRTLSTIPGIDIRHVLYGVRSTSTTTTIMHTVHVVQVPGTVLHKRGGWGTTVPGTTTGFTSV